MEDNDFRDSHGLLPLGAEAPTCFCVLFLFLSSKMETLPYSPGILRVHVDYVYESVYVSAFLVSFFLSFFEILKKQQQLLRLSSVTVRAHLFSTYI